MKHLLFFIPILLIPAFAWAQDDIPNDVLSFSDYEQNARNYCDKKTQEWGQYNSIVPIPQYPELTATAVNRQIARTESLSSLSPEERAKLQRDLDMGRIGNFSEYKTLEVARLQYRAAMNNLFACSVVESRLSILTKMREIIPTKNSEIVHLLQKEERALQTQKSNLQCNSAGTNKIPTMQELVNSATRQYCHYRYYLDYLDNALQNDRSALENIEKEIGTGSGTPTAYTVRDWQVSYQTYAQALDREIYRADTTLPRAMRAFRDMERAYPVHLMLVIIYDDYIRLRNNLSVYMNASTQLYMKAFNAQDANNR